MENVVVMAATNRPEILDDALLRPGRFDYLIYVPPPDKSTRLKILQVHTRKMPLARDVDLNRLAERTEGFSGADLEALCREAALNAIREDREEVTNKDFEEAMRKVKPSITDEMVSRYERFLEERK